MGTVVRLPDAKSGRQRWQVMIRRAGEPFVSKKCESEELARAFMEECEARVAVSRQLKSEALPESGNLGDERLQKTLALYINKHNNPKCHDAHRRVLPTVIRNIDPDLRLSQLTERWIEDFIDLMRDSKTRRGDQFAWATIQKQMTFTKAAIKWRAKRTAQPAPAFHFSMKMFPKDWENERDRRLEPCEERLILRKLREMRQPSRHHWKLLIRFALETGARLGEMVKANWREISACGTFWTIPAKHTKANRQRVVPLTKTARRILRLLRLLADPASPRLFHMLKSAASVSVQFSRWMKKWGIEGLKLHDLRHEGVSRLVLKQRNYTVYEIMDIVGHSDMKMLRRYANLRGDELAKKMI